jgi:hypothetical protein
VALVAFVHIIVERIFESDSIVLLSSLDSNSESSNNRFVCSPRVRNKASSVKEAWSNNIVFEVFLNSALFEMPPNDFNVRVSIISDLEKVKSIIVPVVTLSNIAIVEVIVDIVVIPKIIGRVDPTSRHQ